MRYVGERINNVSDWNVQYDLVIVEEVSQAFYATIIAAKSTALKMICIGDHMQLQPIVRQGNPLHLHPLIDTIINGANTYFCKVSESGFQLTETFRLTARAAAQTSIYYQNPLDSRSEVPLPISLRSAEAAFATDGSTRVQFMNLQHEGRCPISAMQLIKQLVQTILQDASNYHVAVLAPYRITANALQDEIENSPLDSERLHIDTVDRVQGLTCDFTIYLVPSGGIFGYDLNRLNVATSRATRGTLIITDRVYVDTTIFANSKVRAFLESCEVH
jgi:DNA replication ATP-dependent helicase Dna2